MDIGLKIDSLRINIFDTGKKDFFSENFIRKVGSDHSQILIGTLETSLKQLSYSFFKRYPRADPYRINFL